MGYYRTLIHSMEPALPVRLQTRNAWAFPVSEPSGHWAVQSATHLTRFNLDRVGVSTCSRDWRQSAGLWHLSGSAGSTQLPN